MRKILVTLLLLVLFVIVVSGVWIFTGRQISLLLDRYKTIEGTVTRIDRIAYEGSGSGGTLHLNNITLSLASPDDPGPAPEIGTSKDGQMAISFNKTLFAFGPLEPSPDGQTLAARCPPDDKALFTMRYSALAWPNPFDFNFMTGISPSWKRHQYYHLTWTKPTGAKLELVWRYEQYCYPNEGWTSGLMTHAGDTGLIRVHISRAGAP
jgi:hypothetical protein